MQLRWYEIPFLTPTKIFWIQRLIFFFFVDVFHGIIVPLKMEVPWDLNKPRPVGFYVGQGHIGTLEPRRCQGEESVRFSALDDGRKIRKRNLIDVWTTQGDCQGIQSTASITCVAEFSRGEHDEQNNRVTLLKKELCKPFNSPSPPDSLSSVPLPCVSPIAPPRAVVAPPRCPPTPQPPPRAETAPPSSGVFLPPSSPGHDIYNYDVVSVCPPLLLIMHG